MLHNAMLHNAMLHNAWYIALSLCEEILAFSHAFGSLAVRRVAL
jgi:hypothetical protein